MTTGDVLRAAAQRVRQGWCQDTAIFEGKVCAIGAIGCVIPTDYAFYAYVSEVVRQALDLDSVVMWNDAPGRTQEEVALGLERAADYWEAQQAPAIVWTMREDVPA